MSWHSMPPSRQQGQAFRARVSVRTVNSGRPAAARPKRGGRHRHLDRPLAAHPPQGPGAALWLRSAPPVRDLVGRALPGEPREGDATFRGALSGFGGPDAFRLSAHSADGRGAGAVGVVWVAYGSPRPPLSLDTKFDLEQIWNILWTGNSNRSMFCVCSVAPVRVSSGGHEPRNLAAHESPRHAHLPRLL
jgi:hypothetical protein